MSKPLHSHNRLPGQVSAEYLVLLAFVVLLFFSGSPSLLKQFLAAFADYFDRFTTIISLP